MEERKYTFKEKLWVILHPTQMLLCFDNYIANNDRLIKEQAALRTKLFERDKEYRELSEKYREHSASLLKVIDDSTANSPKVLDEKPKTAKSSKKKKSRSESCE